MSFGTRNGGPHRYNALQKADGRAVIEYTDRSFMLSQTACQILGFWDPRFVGLACLLAQLSGPGCPEAALATVRICTAILSATDTQEVGCTSILTIELWVTDIDTSQAWEKSMSGQLLYDYRPFSPPRSLGAHPVRGSIRSEGCMISSTKSWRRTGTVQLFSAAADVLIDIKLGSVGPWR
jgi:hypothetical protein